MTFHIFLNLHQRGSIHFVGSTLMSTPEEKLKMKGLNLKMIGISFACSIGSCDMHDVNVGSGSD